MACRRRTRRRAGLGAARAADETPPSTRWRPRRPPPLALDDAVDNAKDCIQVLGGIGFTWEHDAHLYLRRALALRQLLGGSPGWRTHAAQLPGSAALASPPHRPRPPRRASQHCHQRLGLPRNRPRRHRGAAGTLPRPDAARRDHLVPAVQRARGRLTWPRYGPGRCGPTGLAPDWPEGVDVAGSRGGLGDLPGPHRPRRAQARGITFFLVNMHAPGIDIRPLREITGRTMFNEVFLDDVFVPDDCVLGAPGDGWRVAMSTLATERVAMGGGQDEAVQNLRPRAVRPARIMPNGPACTWLRTGRRPARAARRAPGDPQADRHRAPPGGRRDRLGAARPGRRRRHRRRGSQLRVPAHPLPVASPAAPRRSC